MMGDFGGNAGLLSLWFDHEAWEWRFEYAECPLGTQHLWWFVHIVDFIVLLWVVAYAVATVLVGSGVDVDAKFYHGVSWAYNYVAGRQVNAPAVNGKPRDAIIG